MGFREAMPQVSSLEQRAKGEGRIKHCGVWRGGTCNGGVLCNFLIVLTVRL